MNTWFGIKSLYAEKNGALAPPEKTVSSTVRVSRVSKIERGFFKQLRILLLITLASTPGVGRKEKD